MPAGHGVELGLAGFFEVPHAAEGFGHGVTDHQRAVVAQDHDHFVAQVVGQSLALVQLHRQALGLVVSHLAVEHHGVLAQWQQAALEHRDRHASTGVQVQHAMGVVACGVDGAVDHKAGTVHIVRAVTDLLAIAVDLDQAGRGDLVK